MDLEKIMAQFIFFTGLSAEQSEAWRPICQASVLKISAMLKPTADPLDSRLVSVCAADAYCQFMLLQPGGAQNIKIGDISVSGADTPADCLVFRDNLIASCADLLEYGFYGIRQVE